MTLSVLRPAAACASALLAAATPIGASAQTMPLASGASYALSKTEAILGGQSRLAAILAQQQHSGIATPAQAMPVQPASYSIPRVTPTIRAQALVSPAVASGRPDLFGSVALRVTHTPLDARWHRAERAGIGGRAASFAEGLRDETPLARLEAVNRYVNARVAFEDDSRQYGRADVWSAANTTLSRGRGDCEDYAIAKLQMLRRAGISDRDLYLVIVKDLVRRADHAVLVVRAADRMVLLDNGTDDLLDSETVHDYRPMLTFAANGEWTHGYRRALPEVEIALAEPSKPVIPAADERGSEWASAGQRSRSASLLAFSTGFSR